jgi:hypothetical protein
MITKLYLNIRFKLKNSKVFYERVICIAGIKVLNQTLFLNHLVLSCCYKINDYLQYFVIL